MFIKLTQLPYYSLQDPKSEPVFVNPDFITCMLPYDKKVYRYDLRKPDETTPQETVRVTSIYFPAGLQEEADSVTVLETPEEILLMIGQ